MIMFVYVTVLRLSLHIVFSAWPLTLQSMPTLSLLSKYKDCNNN